MNLFLVILGYYSGCYGPILDVRNVNSSYEYLVKMTCHGPHNDIHNHEQTFVINEWFPVSHLRPVLNKEEAKR